MNIKLEDITFIIPTNKPIVKTLEAIPKECPVFIQREFKQGKARNEGVKKVKTEWIAFVDDDVKFSSVFLQFVLQIANDYPDAVIGLQGYFPSPYLLSRFMIFKKSTIDHVGLLEEVRHGEETEWCIRAEEKGHKLIAIPRESTYHYPHMKGKFKSDLKIIFWILVLHPSLPMKMLIKTLRKIQKSSDDIEYISK